MTTIRILVVDDHPPIRALFRLLSEREPDLNVVGDTGDGAEAVRLARELRPDVVVLDLLLPGWDGGNLIRAVRRVSPRTRILVYTGYASDRLGQAALTLGVDGYLLKSASLAELIAVLRQVHRGEQYADPDVARWAPR
jgi:DNA-binding NarL/FixJ family response regulator